MMKILYSGVTATLLFGLLYVHAASAAQKEPHKVSPKKPTAAAAAEGQVSPEEANRRKDWALSMHKKAAPKKGCFTATYPDTEWKQEPCGPAHHIPMIPGHGPRPFVVGNGNDVSAGAPAGFISQTIGHFENINNVTSESGPIGNSGPSIANTYTLQINMNQFTSTACSGSPNPNCKGWEQFVYENDGASGAAYIQYWLIKYNAPCPAGLSWNQFSFIGSTDIYCWKNDTGGVAIVPFQPITNIGNWLFSGTVSAASDSVTMTVGVTAHTKIGDNAVAAANGWTIAEFNLFGDGGNSSGGGTASFNSGALFNTRTEITYGGTSAPNCVPAGFTAEMNNLSFGPTASPATAPGPAVIFQQSTGGACGS